MSKVRLYRCCTKRDQYGGYVLNSKVKDKLSVDDTLKELTSHILKASQRGVFYSMSPSRSLLLEYKKRNPENVDICYIDIDPEELPKSILSLHPVCSRRYWLNLIALSQEALSDNCIINPEDNSKHSLLAILNVSQRTVSSWSYALREVCIQADNLKLTVLRDEDSADSVSDDSFEQMISDYFLKNINDKNIEDLRALIHKEFQSTELKRKYILNLVDTDSWFAA